MPSTRRARAAAAAPVGRRRGSRFGYSPALDGIRGTAMVAFMAFHFGIAGLQGAWVGINLFFVLSAFLITRLLVEERIDWGHIDVIGFYRRRARRLLPALFLLLSTLCAYGLTLAPPMVRRPMRSDIVATLCYVQNWHLLLDQDQYFQQFNPSFLRHAWTLAVEEQFYLLVPLLLGVLMWLTRRRAAKCLALLALGVLSAAWTAHVGIATPAAQSHVYYGTDTRAQALCIGAALGLWCAPRADGARPPRLPRWAATPVGWVGFAAMVYAFGWIRPFDPWMFDDGGMYVFALGSAALILACADPRPSALTRLLGARPLAYLGRLSYSLYLWHWPIHLWLRQGMPDSPVGVQFAIGMGATVAVSALSYRYLERPVMRGGLRALIPRVPRGGRRIAVGAVTVGIVAVAFTVGSVPSSVALDQAAASRRIPLVPGQPAYRAGSTDFRVALLGDSVPYYLAQRFPANLYSDLHLVNLGVPGCDMMNWPAVLPSAQQQGANCRALKRDLAPRLRSRHVQDLVIFWGTLVPVPHRSPDGTVQTLADAAYRERVLARLDTIRAHALQAGVRHIQIVTVPCRSGNPDVYGVDSEQLSALSPSVRRELTDPVQTNALLRRWAGRHGVPVIDLYAQLCANGYRPRINGVRLYDDGIHFGVEASPMIWTWLAPQIRADFEARGAKRAARR